MRKKDAMNKEKAINAWLAVMSGEQWLLLNNECNLTGRDGLYYTSIIQGVWWLCFHFLFPSNRERPLYIPGYYN